MSPRAGRSASGRLPRTHAWDARWWSPIVNAEHLAVHEPGGAGVEDLSAQAIFEATGGAGAAGLAGWAWRWNPWTSGQARRSAPGSWTRQGLSSPRSPSCGWRPERFLALSPPTAEARDQQWLVRASPSDGRVDAAQHHGGLRGGFGIWGARAMELLEAAAGQGRNDGAEPGATAIGTISVGGAEVLSGPGGRAVRRGSCSSRPLVPSRPGTRWPGLPLGAIAVGSWVGLTTARLEAGGRSRAQDFTGGYDLVEAGLGRPRRRAASSVATPTWRSWRASRPRGCAPWASTITGARTGSPGSCWVASR